MTAWQLLSVAAAVTAGAASAAEPRLATDYLSTDGAWEWWSKGVVNRLATANGSTLAQDCSVFPAVGKRATPDK